MFHLWEVQLLVRLVWEELEMDIGKCNRANVIDVCITWAFPVTAKMFTHQFCKYVSGENI